MSSDTAIKIANLSKAYQVYNKPLDRLLQMLFRGHRRYYQEFWALRDVSLEVKKGETIGIIGRNGSGKSTLLQLICGTLYPSGGTIETRGRIAALLELGSGFNPEFTGRENVYMNASILGLQEAEIDSRFDTIAAFADIGDFIEQPVKTYSSGMMVRLAFAVAINVDPEILIVDEALSVGDELFQRKCFSRIDSIRSSGATILFVSHSGTTVVELCNRAVLLDGGEKLGLGNPKYIVGCYQKLLYAPDEKREELREQLRSMLQGDKGAIHLPDGDDVAITDRENCAGKNDSLFQPIYDPNLLPTSTISYEPQGALITSARILTLSGKHANLLVRGQTYRYGFTVQFNRAAKNVRFGMLIKTISGIELGGALSAESREKSVPKILPGETVRAEFRFCCSLNPGTYFLNAGVIGDINGVEVFLHRAVDIAMFKVQLVPNNILTGIVDFVCFPEITFIDADDI